MELRTCACGCGREFQALTKRRIYFEAKCRGRKRSRLRHFVALDGEGIGNKYTLLAGHKRYIESRAGLTTEQCLDFLLDLPRGAPIYVWFSFDYDVNMILGDIPLRGENSIDQLRETNTIFWRGYRITYLRRKILRIARGQKRHTSYDVWGFFQSSFENALHDWGIEPPPIITEGKQARSDFSKWSQAKIRAYNEAELELLENLSEKLRESVAPLDLPIQSWHGPAALAGSWLQRNRVKEWKGETPNETLSDVFGRAYFGGRIDVQGYGIVEPVYHYDIVSAYPAAIATLPALTNLKWVHRGKGKPSGKFYVSRIRWDIPGTEWPPFPWRSNNGSIRYPLEGEGWYWNYEIETALETYAEYIDVLESYEAVGEIDLPFHTLIHATFRYRAYLKADGNPSHKAVKLILNSLYGKFAQTVGKATYHSPIWAGLITSQTRASLMRALTPDVVCVMTDSLWSAKPLGLTLGSELGDWEQQPEQVLYLAEAGLYEAESPTGERTVWQRGFDKRNPVDIRTLVSTWLNEDPSYSPSYRVNRFVGMGLACHANKPWRHWIDIDRKIEPVPLVGTTKRLPHYPGEDLPRIGDFQPLPIRPRDGDYCSAPYAKLTHDDSLVTQRLEDECLDE